MKYAQALFNIAITATAIFASVQLMSRSLFATVGMIGVTIVQIYLTYKRDWPEMWKPLLERVKASKFLSKGK